MPKEIIFDSPKKNYWIATVNEICKGNIILRNDSTERKGISIIMTARITKSDFTHVHIVLFACMVDKLFCLNYKLNLKIADSELFHFLSKDLKISEYYVTGEPESHVDSAKDYIFNLWKIIPEKVEEYSISAHEYFKREYFSDLDLSGFKAAIDELYFNVTDHSESNGIAYSYIYYEPLQRKIHVAICDFGLGIPFTLIRANQGKYNSNQEALRDSIELFVSAKTNSHNKGMGLDTVISNLTNNDTLRIVSNEGFLICYPNKNPVKVYPLDYDFKGTLIYFDLSTSEFEIEEIISGVNVG
jgi:hypothetical protein